MEDSAIKVVYIRHAQSLFNFWELVKSHKFTQEEIDKYAKDVEVVNAFTSKFDTRMIDPRLSLIGKEQANSTEEYNKMPIRFVFVSPLRRALETCDTIFSRHPNHANIQFIVHPLLREIMNNSNDIPHPLSETKAIYEPKGYNFSHFDIFGVLVNNYEHYLITGLYSEQSDFPMHNGILNLVIQFGVFGLWYITKIVKDLNSSTEILFLIFLKAG